MISLRICILDSRKVLQQKARSKEFDISICSAMLTLLTFFFAGGDRYLLPSLLFCLLASSPQSSPFSSRSPSQGSLFQCLGIMVAATVSISRSEASKESEKDNKELLKQNTSISRTLHRSRRVLKTTDATASAAVQRTGKKTGLRQVQEAEYPGRVSLTGTALKVLTGAVAKDLTGTLAKDTASLPGAVLRNTSSPTGAKERAALQARAKAKEVDIKCGLSQTESKDRRGRINQVPVTKEDQKVSPKESHLPAGEEAEEVEEGLNLNRDKDGLNQNKDREAFWTQR